MYSKYRSKKTEVDGILFDSKIESKHYLKLKELEKQGKIKDLELQPCFELQPKFKKNGKTYRKIEYKADFRYFDIELDKIVIEDVKGLETSEFKLKHKMFEYKYPELELEIVKKW